MVLVTLNKKLKVLFIAGLLACELKGRTYAFHSVPKAHTFIKMVSFSCDVYPGRELQMQEQGLLA